MANPTTVYVFLPDAFADWETGFILPELRTGQLFRKGTPPFLIQTFSLHRATPTVTSMGGLKVVPDLDLSQVSPLRAALLLIPGSNAWMTPNLALAPLFDKVREFLAHNIPVAAICGATLALAREGLLDDRAHTSNDLSFLQQFCPSYKGARLYQSAPAVADKNLITAGGMAPLEFAQAILQHLNVADPQVLETWLNLYKFRDIQHFQKLMQLLA
jgi:putative intracellular protease/amidase